MGSLKVAILGAGGFGRFHAREFNLLGCDVKAILGRTEESARKTSLSLRDEFGITTKPYSDLGELLKKEDLDVVSVCVPPKMHFDFCKTCLEYGKHVFCEKPFTENVQEARELFDLAKKKGKIIMVDTQWSSLSKILNLTINSVKKLRIHMEPGEEGINMLSDHLPHMNSMLISLLGKRDPREVKLKRNNSKEISVDFFYGDCFVEYELTHKKSRPRNIKIIIDGKTFRRVVDGNYNQFFETKDEKIAIKDPLRESIRRFIGEIKDRSPPLVTRAEIIKNLEIQEELIQIYRNNYGFN